MSVDIDKISVTKRRLLIEAARDYGRKTGNFIVHMPFSDCGADIVTVNLHHRPPTISNYEQSPCLKDFY
jgi:hypothetical protein